MDKGVYKGWFFPHDKTVAMNVATLVAQEGATPVQASEDDLFANERRAFTNLAKTPETLTRILSLLETGTVVRN